MLHSPSSETHSNSSSEEQTDPPFLFCSEDICYQCVMALLLF